LGLPRSPAICLNVKPLKANENADKSKYFNKTIEHIDVTKNAAIVPLVDAMQHMAYSSRDLHRAADIYDRMLRDQDCGVILTLAGSLISAGLKKVFVDMIRNNMVDAIVSTGANIVDQDFFEALGFRHYVAAEELKTGLYDGELLSSTGARALRNKRWTRESKSWRASWRSCARS
jgi:deoxyhypusine synthase